MRLIDAHELIKNKFKNPISYAAFCNLVGRQPTVDAVPVVRCKDCKHRFLEDKVWACPFGLPGGPEFFCSYGMDGKDGDRHDSN